MPPNTAEEMLPTTAGRHAQYAATHISELRVGAKRDLRTDVRERAWSPLAAYNCTTRSTPNPTVAYLCRLE